MLDRLDKRGTTYRFDLHVDVPWQRLSEPGAFFTDALLSKLGFDVARLGEARVILDRLLAIATAEIFKHLELDVIKFVDGEGARRPSKSAVMLIEEERKHVELFERLLASLRAQFPDEGRALAQHFVAPPSFDNLRARVKDYANDDEVAFTFWLNTLFFEEYTIFLQHALEEQPRALHATWLAAHRCHRQEELQHVLTDAAYLASLPLGEERRRSLSKSFLFFLDESYGTFFGITSAVNALRAMRPDVEGLPVARRLRDLPLFDDVLSHRAFRQTRIAAPYLAQQQKSFLDGGPPAIVLSPEDSVVGRLESADRGEVIFEDVRWSYPELLREAEARLAALQHEGARAGDFVVLLTSRPSSMAPWFWACLLGGLKPAPLALPTTASDAEELKRLMRIHAQLGDPWVVADDMVAPLVPGRVIKASARVDGASVKRHRATADDVAFLQFSSGSLGEPRGVVLTHGNLLADITAMIAHRSKNDAETFVSWMPLFHDMGLIGYHVTPIVARARQVLLSPLTFMRDPLSWLRALTEHRGTITGAPNFALARLLPKLSAQEVGGLDLSSVETFLIGAEPIAKNVLEQFSRALAPAGLRATALCPAYGLAEATLAVSMTPRDETWRAIAVRRDTLDGKHPVVIDDNGLELVEVGTVLPGVKLRIVDETGDVVPQGVVGTIELHGPTVSARYHGESAPREWLDTGDLGLTLGDRLYVTGRKKDVFFVGGRNHYAHDVESVVRELPFLHPGAIALVVDWDSTWGVDELLLFVALRDDVGDRRAALAQAHAHVLKRLGISLGTVIEIDKREVPRTTSGKLRRRGLLARVRAGELDNANTFSPHTTQKHHEHETIEVDEALDVVRSIWAAVLELPRESVGADDDFRSLGGDSFKAVQVHDRLEKAFASSFSPDILVVGTTPRKMARFVVGEVLSVDPQAAAQPAAVGIKVSDPVPRDPIPRDSIPHDPIASHRVADDPAADDPIVVISLAVRAPQVRTPAELWRLLIDGRTTIGRVPAARLDEARLFGSDALAVGSWLEAIDMFDPAPFSLTDSEARAMGPAQRLFLEVAFEALAGVTLSSRRVGVFAGAGSDAYARRYNDDPSLVSGHSLLGALPNMVAARVARAFALTGPALTIDTACSSSLAAVHHACASLRAGECDVALAGGVQVGLAGDLLLSFERAGLLSSSGQCRPFDDAAAGLVPGEAAAVVALKPLSRARADRDHVFAIIRGSAMNNDGGALSSTAPSPKGQSEVIARAWRSAGLDPSTASFVEAHAAGTAIGDAVEVRALADVIKRPCAIGSIKGNIGHTLAAAGIMSFLKAVLALAHRRVPPTCGLERPAARIDFARTSFTTSTTPLEAAARAGVSSFGLGGTNVHVVLESAIPEPAPVVRGPVPALARGPIPALAQGPVPALAQAPVPAVLAFSVAQAKHIAASPAPLDDVIAAAAGYAELTHDRRAVVVRSREDIAVPGAIARRGKVAFVFPGPGSQVPGMGRALYDAEPAFRAALDRCAHIAARKGIDLLPLMFEDGDRIHRLENSQPAVFSFGYAMAIWLKHLGVLPDVVVGHSAGEYVAAHVAKMVSLDDALDLVVERGRAMAAAAPGRMAAALASRDKVARCARVNIAAINAPEQTVISGSASEIANAIIALEQHGIVVRPLEVDCAAHSDALRSMPFEALLKSVRFSAGEVPLVSTTTADLLPQPTADHFARHLMSPVDFVGAVRRARALGADAFVELGATAGLSSCVSQILDDVLVVATGVRASADLTAPYEAVATLINAGLPVRTSCLGPRAPRPPSEILSFPYSRKRLWIESRGPSTSLAPGYRVSCARDAAIRDHKTAGMSSAPASLLIDLVVDDLGGVDLSDVVVLRPLFLEDNEERLIEVVVDPAHSDGRLLRSSSSSSGPHAIHLSTKIARRRGRVVSRLDLDDIRARLSRDIAGERIYARLDRTGFVMGPAMRAVDSVHLGDDELLARLTSPPGTSRGRRVDPALLDGASHAVAAFFERGESLYLGFSIERVRLYKPVHDRCLAYVRLRANDANIIRYDIALLDDNGELLAEIEDFAAKSVASPQRPQPQRDAEGAAASLDHAHGDRASSDRASSDRASFGRASFGRASLIALVRTLVAARLRRAPEQIPEHAPLVRLGVDSLMAVELVRKLEQELNMKLYATLLFEATTVSEVVDRLVQLRDET